MCDSVGWPAAAEGYSYLPGWVYCYASRFCQHSDIQEMTVLKVAMPGVQHGYSAIIYMLKLGITCLYIANAKKNIMFSKQQESSMSDIQVFDLAV